MSGDALIVTLCCSLAANVGLAWWLSDTAVKRFLAAPSSLTAAAAPAAAEPELPPPRPSCEGDVSLAAVAHALWCATPFADGDTVGACFDEVRLALADGRDACHAVAVADTPVTISLIDPITPEELDEILPEPLLDIDPEVLAELAKQQEVQQQEQQAQQRAQEAKLKGQVVEVARPAVEVAPAETRFLSEYDSTVERETVARGSKYEEMIARPEAAELTPVAKPREASVPELRPDEPVGRSPDAPKLPGVFSMRAPGSAESPNGAELATTAGALDGTSAPATFGGIAPRRGDGAFTNSGHDPIETPRGQGGAGGGAPAVPNLQPRQEVLERVAGGGSVDYLEDVDDGDETSVNSKRSLHAQFFNRIKRQIAQNWDPGSIHARRDPTGRVYGTKTRITKLQVSLDGRGQVEKIYVIEASGVDFLDDEAVRAFRASSPFPNVPAALVSNPFTFGFYFELSEASTWKIFRPQ